MVRAQFSEVAATAHGVQFSEAGFVVGPDVGDVRRIGAATGSAESRRGVAANGGRMGSGLCSLIVMQDRKPAERGRRVPARPFSQHHEADVQLRQEVTERSRHSDSQRDSRGSCDD